MISDELWQRLDQPLLGKNIILEPLHAAHYDDLLALDDDPTVWPFLLIPDFKEWFEEALQEQQQKKRASYVVRQTDNQQIIGSTSYYDISEKHCRCNIGYTWYHHNVRGAKVNADCKLTLLSYGFETLGWNRIALTADTRNLRSQRAIEKLGAVREGVFRKFKMFAGQPCDLVYFSILNNEWPQAKANLEKRLDVHPNDSKLNPFI